MTTWNRVLFEEASNVLTSQETRLILWIPNVHCSVNKSVSPFLEADASSRRHPIFSQSSC